MPSTPISLSSSSSSSSFSSNYSSPFSTPSSSPHRNSNTSTFLSPSPPLSPVDSLRERYLCLARKRGWLSAPGAYQHALLITHAYNNNLLPSPKSLHNPTSPKRRTRTPTTQQSNHSTNIDSDIDSLTTNLSKHLHLTSTPSPPLYSWLPTGNFATIRKKASEQLLYHFDHHALQNVLCLNNSYKRVSVDWSNRLYKTAGVTYLRTCSQTGERIARIVLSEKVVDDVSRLYKTLAHEMCHAAMWIVDGVMKPAHGRCFWKWVRVFEQFDNDLEITVCHDYEIRFRFYYVCDDCGEKYGRHSKSIDTNKKVCGVCRGRLVLEDKR